MQSFLHRGLSLALLIGGLGSVSSALGDEVIIRKFETVPQPIVTMPTSQTTTTTTVEPSVPVENSFTRTTIVSPAAPLVPFIHSSASTTTSTTTTDLDKRPEYRERLARLKDQLDNSCRKGWLSSGDAITFNNEYAGLVSQEADVRAHNYLKFDCDNLEKALNNFNIELSQHISTASAAESH